MKEMLQKLREASVAAILQADDITALENLRVKYLGKKGELTAILKQMGTPVGGGAPGHGPAGKPGARRAGGKRSTSAARRSSARMLEMRLKAGDARCDHARQARRSSATSTRCISCSTRSRTSSSAWALRSSKAPRSKQAELQLHQAQHQRGPPRPRVVGHLLSDRGQQHPAAHADLPDAGARHGDASRCRSASSPPAAFTARTRSTPRTRPCSTRSRAWSSTRASPWPT